MVETAAGHRVLLAPSPSRWRTFVEATYVFDEMRRRAGHGRGRGADGVAGPVAVAAAHAARRCVVRRWAAAARGAAAGSRRAPAWCALTDPVARVVLRGVRTRGTASGGRREWYGATDTRAVTALAGSFDGAAARDAWPRSTRRAASASPRPRGGRR